MNPSIATAKALIKQQFPEYADLDITSVKAQGHDNRTYRLGDKLLIRIPTAKPYALKLPQEYALLKKLKPHLTVEIPSPVKIGQSSALYPFPFSIYQWLEGESANHLDFSETDLKPLAHQLADFLKTLQQIDTVKGPVPGQHNWWRGAHLRVYDSGARQQITQLKSIIDATKAIALWEQACKTKWCNPPVWIHGDFATGNFLIKNNKLSAVIDFGCTGVGDPACDLVIAWTFLKGQSSELFKKSMELDTDTWLRARAWALWKATFTLCNIENKQSRAALYQSKLIENLLLE